mmetsp:Transcript_53644/g.122802  ORF Transcript_53644/g.122802 Transcript_53644/m.122802 type:complete len:376 (-) Transcript_53644:133-1260(-)
MDASVEGNLHGVLCIYTLAAGLHHHGLRDIVLEEQHLLKIHLVFCKVSVASHTIPIQLYAIDLGQHGALANRWIRMGEAAVLLQLADQHPTLAARKSIRRCVPGHSDRSRRRVAHLHTRITLGLLDFVGLDHMSHAPNGDHKVDALRHRRRRLRKIHPHHRLAITGQQRTTGIAWGDGCSRLKAQVAVHILMSRDHSLGNLHGLLPERESESNHLITHGGHVLGQRQGRQGEIVGTQLGDQALRVHQLKDGQIEFMADRHCANLPLELAQRQHLNGHAWGGVDNMGVRHNDWLRSILQDPSRPNTASAATHHGKRGHPAESNRDGHDADHGEAQVIVSPSQRREILIHSGLIAATVERSPFRGDFRPVQNRTDEA